VALIVGASFHSAPSRQVSLTRIESRSWKSAVAQRTDERSIQPAGIFSINGPCCIAGVALALASRRSNERTNGRKNIAECRRPTTEASRLSADGGNLRLPSRCDASSPIDARARTLIALALRQTSDGRLTSATRRLRQFLVAPNAPSEGQCSSSSGSSSGSSPGHPIHHRCVSSLPSEGILSAKGKK